MNSLETSKSAWIGLPFLAVGFGLLDSGCLTVTVFFVSEEIDILDDFFSLLWSLLCWKNKIERFLNYSKNYLIYIIFYEWFILFFMNEWKNYKSYG